MKTTSLKSHSSNPTEGASFLQTISRTPPLNSLLEAISSYRVLVVGDGIVDEYCYVKPLGKSPKENIITARITGKESFAGGAWAAGRHVKGFCAKVDIATAPGFVVKRRFVEEAHVRKMFEVHEERRVDTELDEPIYENYDLVIVADFGHGFITTQMIEALTRRAKFLAVNAQTNSANHGFNLITKYPRADFVVLDELEARLAAHDRDSPIENVIERLGFHKIIVTLGQSGCIGYDGAFCTDTAGVNRVVDTMGAGDAFFCVTAPFAAAGADMATLCRIGNAAGAIKCGVVGHRKSVTKEALMGELA